MLVPLLVQVLEQTGDWLAVVRMPIIVRADYRLHIDNFTLQQEFFDRPSRVRVQLRVQMVHLRDQCVMGTHEFDMVQLLPSDDAYGGVLAASRAAANLLEQLAGWVGNYADGQHSCRP